MVASSLQAAKDLVRECEFTPDATRANNGVLIGKGEIEALQRDEQLSIMDYFRNVPGFGEAPDIAAVYRSALVERSHASACGTVYRTGDDAVVSQEGNTSIVKILKFYLVVVNQEYIPVVTGDSYRIATDTQGHILRHPLSDTIVIEPFETCTCFQVQDLDRKVMLYPFQPGKLAVVDPMRARIPIPQVLVPVFPQVGDMVSVQGGDEELWRAEVRAIDHVHKTVRGYFFVKHHQFNENQLWKRESMGHAMDTIHFKSIVSILEGQWQGPYWKDNR